MGKNHGLGCFFIGVGLACLWRLMISIGIAFQATVLCKQSVLLDYLTHLSISTFCFETLHLRIIFLKIWLDQMQQFSHDHQSNDLPLKNKTITTLQYYYQSMQEPFLNEGEERQDPNFPPQQPYNPRGQNLFEPTSAKFPQGRDQPNKLQGRQSEGHGKALLATMILIIGAILAFVVKIGDSTGISILIFFASYIIYIVIGCYNNQLISELQTITESGHFQEYYDQLRAVSGLFAMDADCYHTETRTEERTVTDSDGNSKTQTTSYDVSVTTHTDHLQMAPFITQDESGRLENFIANNEIVTVDFKVMYYHLDSQSERKLEQIYANFKMRNMKDSYQKFTIKYIIPNVVLKKTFMFKDSGCEYSTWFYLFGLVGLIWPYSIWVESKIDRYEVKLIKAIQF